MNWKRILLGGVAAGVLIDLMEGVLSAAVVGNRYAEEIRRLGLTGEPSPLGIAFLISIGFIVGTVNVWVYALVRPRLGAGPRTAALVGAVLWVLLGLVPHLQNAALGIFSLELSLRMAGIQLCWMVGATLLGASIYREA
jgi:hypothetical protein